RGRHGERGAEDVVQQPEAASGTDDQARGNQHNPALQPALLRRRPPVRLEPDAAALGFAIEIAAIDIAAGTRDAFDVAAIDRAAVAGNALRKGAFEMIAADEAAVAQIAREAIARNAIARDAIALDAISGDAFAGNAIASDGFDVAAFSRNASDLAEV